MGHHDNGQLVLVEVGFVTDVASARYTVAIMPPSWAVDMLIVDFLRKIDVHISVAISYCSVNPIVIIAILVVKEGSKAEVAGPCGPLELTQAS